MAQNTDPHANVVDAVKNLSLEAQDKHPTHRFIMVGVPIVAPADEIPRIALFSGVSPSELHAIAAAILNGIAAQVALASLEPTGKPH